MVRAVPALTATFVAALTPLAAMAQNQSNPLAPLGVRPGAVPTGAGAIPLLGTGQNVIRGGQVVPVNQGGTVITTSGGVIVPPNGSYTPNPYYGYGGNNSTVIINNNGYPYYNGYNSYGYNNGYTNGYNGYITGALPNPTIVVPGTPVTQTVITGGAVNVTLFNGYSAFWSSGQTVLSPFGSFYGSPAYIGSRYVVATPYPYLYGRETTVLNGITILGYDGANYATRAPQTGTQAPSEGYDDTPSAAANAISERKATLLRDALSDVQAFWVNEDVRAMRRRLLPTGMVGVFQNERFAYSLRRTDFLAVSSDTLDRIQTQSLKFKRVVSRDDGLVNAYATHTYRVRGTKSTAPGDLRTATVRVTFIWDGGDWFVSAISFAPGSLAQSSGR